MTVAAPSYTEKSWTGNGATVSFSFQAKVLETADLQVWLVENGVETLKSLASHYTLNGVGSPGGVTIVFVTPPTAAQQVKARRNTIPKQTVGYTDLSKVPGPTTEGQLDRFAMALFDQKARIDNIETETRAYAGEWSASLSYLDNQIVRYGGRLWIAEMDNENVTPGNSSEVWSIYLDGLNPVGTWSIGTTYQRNDILESGGSIWRALRTSTGVTPVEGVDWALFLAGVTVADASITRLKLALNAVDGDVIGAANAQSVRERIYTGTAGFWEDIAPYGVIHRVRDRILLGNAVQNQGGLPTPENPLDDWLEQDFPATTSAAQFAVLSTIGHSAVLGGSRTSENNGAGSMGCIGLHGRVINDNAAQVQSAYGAYVDAKRKAGAGNTHALEIDIVNDGDLSMSYPFKPIPDGNKLSNGFWVASGGEVGLADATNAIAIINNGRRFRSGIIFQENSLAAETGYVAMGLWAEHTIRWFYTGSGTSRRVDDGATISFRNTSDVEIAAIKSGSNGIILSGAALHFQNIAGTTASGATPTTYLPITVNGTNYRLPIYAP